MKEFERSKAQVGEADHWTTITPILHKARLYEREVIHLKSHLEFGNRKEKKKINGFGTKLYHPENPHSERKQW